MIMKGYVTKYSRFGKQIEAIMLYNKWGLLSDLWTDSYFVAVYFITNQARTVVNKTPKYPETSTLFQIFLK